MDQLCFVIIAYFAFYQLTTLIILHITLTSNFFLAYTSDIELIILI